MAPAELLVSYKHQPHLELQHHLLKGEQLVAPVFLRDPARIEGVMTFTSSHCWSGCSWNSKSTCDGQPGRRRISTTSRRPALSFTERGTPRMIEAFTGVARHRLFDTDSRLAQTFAPVLTQLQEQLLDLLGVPLAVYA